MPGMTSSITSYDFAYGRCWRGCCILARLCPKTVQLVDVSSALGVQTQVLHTILYTRRGLQRGTIVLYTSLSVCLSCALFPSLSYTWKVRSSQSNGSASSKPNISKHMSQQGSQHFPPDRLGQPQPLNIFRTNQPCIITSLCFPLPCQAPQSVLRRPRWCQASIGPHYVALRIMTSRPKEFMTETDDRFSKSDFIAWFHHITSINWVFPVMTTPPVALSVRIQSGLFWLLRFAAKQQ